MASTDVQSQISALRAEIDAYLQTTSGSGIDVPPWLRSLEAEVDRFESEERQGARQPAMLAVWPADVLSLRRLRQQFAAWDRSGKK